MNNYLLYKATHKLHKFGFYYYSVKYYIQDTYIKRSSIFFINFFNFIFILIKALFKEIKIFNNKSGYLEYLEIPITTKCTLKCKDCSNLIPYYKNSCAININTLLKSIDIFLKCINNIVYIRVLGGEPFISPNLTKTLKTLLESNKIQRIEIVTNGTIIPSEQELINVLSNKRIIVSISQYPNVNTDNFINFLITNNIIYKIDKKNFWMDYGGTEKRYKTLKKLKKQFRNCNHICNSLLNGQLHLCPRSSHGTDLGIITNNDDDYLNLLDNNISIENKKKKIFSLLKKKYIVACDYCDFATKQCKKIKVAEQIKNNKKGI